MNALIVYFLLFLTPTVLAELNESKNTTKVIFRPNLPVTINCTVEIRVLNETLFWFFNGQPINTDYKKPWTRFHFFNHTKSIRIDFVRRNETITCAACVFDFPESCSASQKFEFVSENYTNIRQPCSQNGNITIITTVGNTRVPSCVCDYGFKGDFCEIPFVGKFRLILVFWVLVICETLCMAFVIYRHAKQTIYRPPVDGFRFVDVLNGVYSRQRREEPPSPQPEEVAPPVVAEINRRFDGNRSLPAETLQSQNRPNVEPRRHRSLS